MKATLKNAELNRLCPSSNIAECVSPELFFFSEGTLSERLRRQIRNLLGFARAGSNPAGVVLLLQKLVQWPSGLRRSTQVRVSSEAWVRTPPEPFFVCRE